MSIYLCSKQVTQVTLVQSLVKVSWAVDSDYPLPIVPLCTIVTIKAIAFSEVTSPPVPSPVGSKAAQAMLPEPY